MINHDSNVYLVTGASSGIGKELTLQLASRNKKVIAIARNEAKLQQLKNYNANHIDIINADIGTEEGREQVVSFLPNNCKIAALINNAGVMAPSGYLEEISLSDFRSQLAVNVEAPLFLIQKLLPYLSGGRVLNLTIYSSFRVTPGLGCYGITKSALNMLTQYYHHELQKHDIAVGNALPGIVDTNIQKQLPKNITEITDKINRLKSEGKLIQPEVSASFLKWLLLDIHQDDFGGKTWDIYDTDHHIYWASNLKIPLIK